MSEFRTTVSINGSESKIGFKTPVFTIGSCFSDVIGNRLSRLKVPTAVNPFGTVYNPVSLHNLVTSALVGQPPDIEKYVTHDGVAYHLDFHSSFASTNVTQLQERLTATLAGVANSLRTTEWLLVTYGTAWIYTHQRTKSIVANCHKLPAKEFQKSLLTVEEIKQSFRRMVALLDEQGIRCRKILTVSPVRHVKDTLPLNAVSKSILRLACHELQQEMENVEYFPSFEIMTDDLRDYRFYQADMIHPNDTAENYIWEKFAGTYFTQETRLTMEAVEKIQRALAHRPFQPASAAHRAFLDDTMKRIEELSPKVNLQAEKSMLLDLLKSLAH